MFFPEKISKIKKGDLVLEIGPGWTPHPRSNIYLDIRYKDRKWESFQKGNAKRKVLSKPMIYYDGLKFPFKSKVFDYIICSHVIEHVYDIPKFLNEVFRVGRRGYFEYPTGTYEYLYNFDIHTHLVSYENGILYYMPKRETLLSKFKPFQNVLFDTLNLGFTDHVDQLTELFIQGFEWNFPFECLPSTDFSKFAPLYKTKVRKNQITIENASTLQLLMTIIKRTIGLRSVNFFRRPV